MHISDAEWSTIYGCIAAFHKGAYAAAEGPVQTSIRTSFRTACENVLALPR
jgi:hypothetical protein